MSKKKIQALVAQVAVNNVFGQFRYMVIEGEIWFMAADVCKILGIKNVTQAVSNIDEDFKHMFNIGLAGRAPIFVNEPGLYNLIFQSRKPEAKEFQRWVYREVLPSIRATGSYSLPKKKEVKEITTGNLVKKVLEKYPDAEPELIDISFSEDEDGNIITHYHFGYQLPDGTFI